MMQKSTAVQISHKLVSMGGQASPGAILSVARDADKSGMSMYCIYATNPEMQAATLEYPAVVVVDEEPAKYCKLFDVKTDYPDIVCFTISG